MRFWPLVLLAALVACDGDDAEETAPSGECVDCGGAPFPDCAAGWMQPFREVECTSVGWTACPTGFVPDPSGWGCRDRLPEAPCTPGTMSRLGDDACVNVGDRECAVGFERDASGWGCRAILPAQPCTGATRAALGHTQCVQLGDCDADFPPPEATVFVDDDFTDAELDLTHFRTIQGALANTGDGTVIAVEAGEYQGGLEIYTQVSIVGRCAAKVHIDAEGSFSPGIWINAPSVNIRGMTLRRPELGFYVNSFAATFVTVSNLVIEEASGWGVYVPGAFEEPSSPLQLLLDGVVVRNTRMSGEGSLDGGIGIYVESGTVDIDNSDISGNLSAGVATVYGGSATLRNTVIHDSQGMGWMLGGVYASENGTVMAYESALLDNEPYAAWVFGNNAYLQLNDSVVGSPGGSDAAVQVGTGASLQLTESTMHASPSVSFEGGSTGNINSATLRGMQLVWGPSNVNLSESVVVDGGVRAYGSNSSVYAGSTVFTGSDQGYPAILADGGAIVSLEGSAIESFEGNGLVVIGASQASLINSVVREVTAGEAAALATGFRGAVALSGGGQLLMTTSAVVDSAPYGIEILSDGAGTAATLDGSLVRGTHASDDDSAEATAPTAPAGIRIGGTSTLLLSDSGLSDNEGHALLADGSATIGVTKVVVAHNRGSGEDDGAAMWIGGGATAGLDQTAFAGNIGVGLVATDVGRVGATNSLFMGNRAGSKGRARAVVASEGGGIELTGSNVVGSEEVGLEVSGIGSVLRVTEGMIGTSSRGDTSDMGHGAVSLTGGEMHLTRVRFYGAAGAAAAFFGGGGSVTTSILDHNARAVHIQGTPTSAEGPGSSSTLYLHTNNRFIDNLAEVTRDSLEAPSAFDADP